MDRIKTRPTPSPTPRLTSLAHGGGCGCKLAPSVLQELLAGLPVEVPAAARSRLRSSLMPLFGADAVVWTRDVADLSVTDAVDVLVWMARTMVTAVLTSHRPPDPR